MIEVSLMFGGNLGDVPGAFACALRELENNGFQVHAKSSVFLTAPVDCVPGTPDFQNMAVLFVVDVNDGLNRNGYWCISECQMAIINRK